jgi:hypothetical protein
MWPLANDNPLGHGQPVLVLATAISAIITMLIKTMPYRVR